MATNAGAGVAGATGSAGRAQAMAGAMGMLPGVAGAMMVSAGRGAAGAAGGTVDASVPMGPVDASMPLPAGPAPALPAIRGACPEFRDGSKIMVGGHGGILIVTGAPAKGGALLFSWHGTGGSAEGELGRLPMAVRSEIIAAGGIIAAFDGKQSSGTGTDCSGTGAHNEADFDAADQIAACAVQNYGIDPRRIYTAGCSAGGLQSGCMALMRSSYIAAAATDSGGLVPPEITAVNWQDKHTPAIFTMHGGPSDMVVVNFSETSALLDMNAKNHGGFVVNCNHGAGHCASTPELRLAAWRFLKDHPWGVEKSPWAGALPAGVPASCRVY